MGAGLQKVARMCGGIVAMDSKRVTLHKWNETKGKTCVERGMSREEYEQEKQGKDSPSPGR